MAPNRAIGYQNKLLFRDTRDLKFFKGMTQGTTVIMGRKTFESIGGPLTGRRNVILTKSALKIQGVEIASSVGQALELVPDDVPTFVIGGQSVYEQFLPHAVGVFLTVFGKFAMGDTFFPALPGNVWSHERMATFEPDAQNPWTVDFMLYRRR